MIESCIIHVLRLETTVAQRVSHVEQELHTFSEHLCASCVFIGVRVAHCIHFCAMFVHITVCPFVPFHLICFSSSSIYGFLLSPWYLQTVLRWYLTLQGDNSLKSVERFDHMMFVCRFQASR